jgi:hypothetical protein
MLNVVYYDEYDLSFRLDDVVKMMMMMIQELEWKIVEIKRLHHQHLLMVVVKQLFRSVQEK